MTKPPSSYLTLLFYVVAALGVLISVYFVYSATNLHQATNELELRVHSELQEVSWGGLVRAIVGGFVLVGLGRLLQITSDIRWLMLKGSENA